jgi:hypothetical protein
MKLAGAGVLGRQARETFTLSGCDNPEAIFLNRRCIKCRAWFSYAMDSQGTPPGQERRPFS